MRALWAVVAALWGLAAALDSGGANATAVAESPAVRYLIRTEAWGAAAIGAYGSFWAASNATALPSSTVDDSPMDRAPLARGFPFLDRRRYEASARRRFFFSSPESEARAVQGT